MQPSGDQKDGSLRVLNQDSRDDERGTVHPTVATASLVLRLVCGQALSCRRTDLNLFALPRGSAAARHVQVCWSSYHNWTPLYAQQTHTHTHTHTSLYSRLYLAHEMTI